MNPDLATPRMVATVSGRYLGIGVVCLVGTYNPIAAWRRGVRIRTEVMGLLHEHLQRWLVPPHPSRPLHEIFTFSATGAVRRHLVGESFWNWFLGGSGFNKKDFSLLICGHETFVLGASILDLHTLSADPDPVFFDNADPDPGSRSKRDICFEMNHIK